MYFNDRNGFEYYLLHEVELNFEPIIIEASDKGFVVIDESEKDAVIYKELTDLFPELTYAEYEHLTNYGKVVHQGEVIQYTY